MLLSAGQVKKVVVSQTHSSSVFYAFFQSRGKFHKTFFTTSQKFSILHNLQNRCKTSKLILHQLSSITVFQQMNS